jgi:hypothetical protein
MALDHGKMRWPRPGLYQRTSNGSRAAAQFHYGPAADGRSRHRAGQRRSSRHNGADDCWLAEPSLEEECLIAERCSVADFPSGGVAIDLASDDSDGRCIGAAHGNMLGRHADAKLSASLNLCKAQAIASDPGVPHPTPNTLYFVYLPPGVRVV